LLDWTLTLLALAVSIGLSVFANWKAEQPWDDMKPKRVPWRPVMILGVFGVLLALVHLANLAGLETGPEHSLLGRR
jgi:hypothetical protein